MNRPDTKLKLIILSLLLALGGGSFVATRARSIRTAWRMSHSRPDNSQTIRLRVHSRYEEGDPLARRGLEMRECALGPDDMGVAADVAALAAILDGEGKRYEAERFYLRALAAFERTDGGESYDVAVNLNNLAALYQAE